ncbi:hypothetical protein HDV02_005625 [Globomyces sp. JEL0801]|nr:hypothetical protein HDV02_005625 [Globomyces sp. JEL0801]
MKPSDPKRYHAEKSRPPITPTPPPTDFFWEGRANSNIRHRRIISHTSTQESRSPLPPKGIPPKPSNPFSRTKTTLCTEDPDYDQRIEANLEWKAELEKQIEEKRKRERFEKQRNELEESMNLAKVYREDFDQRQPTKNPPHHLKPHQNITWPCLDKGSETCKEIYTKKPKPSKIPRSNLKKRQAQHPEIKKNEKSNKNESKMESSAGGSDNIHVNPDVEPNQINQTADTERQNETATENIQNPESAQKNIASLAERESGAKLEVDQVPNISRKTTIKPNDKNDTQKPKHRRQGTGGVVEQKVTEIEQRLQEQTKEEQRILAEKLAHQKLNQQKANQKKMLRDEHNRVQLPSINEQGSISTPRSRKPSKGESVSRKGNQLYSSSMQSPSKQHHNHSRTPLVFYFI